MRMHRMAIGLLLVGSCFVILYGCAPDDADRCRSGWRYEGGDCLLLEEDTETTSSSDQDTDTDSSTVTDELPSGLGDPCQSSDDCAGKDASYCAVDPETEEGSCNISDCLDGTNECPKGLVCCAFSKVTIYPDMCLPQAQYDEYKNTVGC